MIPSQQPMMLDTALAFEQAIKKPKTSQISHKDDKVQVTWDSPNELESYIGQLQSIADRLTSENRRLRKCHTTLIEKVLIPWSVCPFINHPFVYPSIHSPIYPSIYPSRLTP